jgi:hypothetical protein
MKLEFQENIMYILIDATVTSLIQTKKIVI